MIGTVYFNFNYTVRMEKRERNVKEKKLSIIIRNFLVILYKIEYITWQTFNRI